INFGYQIGAAYEAITAVGDGVREEHPRQQARISEERVGYTVGRNTGQPAEEQREDQHRKERLNDRPRGPEQCLFVAHLDITPCQEIDQLSIRPEVPEVERGPFAARSDADQRAIRQTIIVWN